MALPEEKVYTIDDIYDLSEGTRAELIDGQIYYMPPSSSRHQEISGDLYVTIHNYIKSNKGTCKVYSAPFAVYIKAHDDRFYVKPDINPKAQLITVYYFESEILAQPYTFGDKVKVNIYDDLTIDFSQLDI